MCDCDYDCVWQRRTIKDEILFSTYVSVAEDYRTDCRLISFGESRKKKKDFGRRVELE